MFTVDRSKWRCGGNPQSNKYLPNKVGKGVTELRNPQGYKCCLGFCAEQLGVDIPDFAAEPNELECKDENCLIKFEYGLVENSDLSEGAMSINDESTTSPQEKEVKLIELFKEYGQEIQFVGEYSEQ